MTSPTIQLMNSCRDLVKVPAFKNDFWTVTQEELERFYVKAQAQALRDAAKKFNSVPMPAHWVVRVLNGMADKLEKQYV